MTQPRPAAAVLPGASRLIASSAMNSSRKEPDLCDDTELRQRVKLIFATFQTDLGLANAFRWEFPADGDGSAQKLKAAMASWYRVELGRVPKVLFELALRRLGAEHQVGRANKSLPSFGDFMVLCRAKPEAVGLPAANDAWAEATRHAMSTRHRWSHPAVLLAAKATGTHDMRHASGFELRELRQRFDRHYEQLVLQVATGQELSMPLAAIGNDADKPVAVAANEYNERLVQERLAREGLAGAGLNAREQLLSKLRIKRGGAADEA